MTSDFRTKVTTTMMVLSKDQGMPMVLLRSSDREYLYTWNVGYHIDLTSAEDMLQNKFKCTEPFIKAVVGDSKISCLSQRSLRIVIYPVERLLYIGDGSA